MALQRFAVNACSIAVGLAVPFILGLLSEAAGSAFIVSPPASPQPAAPVPGIVGLRGRVAPAAASAPYMACSVVAGAIAASAATAFLLARPAKANQAQSKVVSVKAFESELGVQAPFGFWDPLGLSKDGNEANFKRRRSTEIKHGRISMLATMGYITPEITGKFPGYLSPSMGLKFEDIPNGLAAISKVPATGWQQIFVYCLAVEASGTGFTYFDRGEPSGIPGDYGWKPPLLTSNDPEKTKKRLNAELANGRLAMMAIIGMFFQDGLTGSAWGDWSNYTDSPLR